MSTPSIAEKLAAKVEEIILARIEQNKLGTGVMPEFATRLLSAVRDENCTAKRVVRLLEQEPIAAARTMKVAGSAAFGGTAVKNLEAAVTRLGMQKLHTLLVELSARQLFTSRDRRIARTLHDLWEHSVAVALLARDLSALSDQDANIDTAYLCGLLHDVGKPVVASILLEAEQSMAKTASATWVDADDWLEVIRKTHRKVGVAVTIKWQLPEEVTQAVREGGDFDAADPHAPANFVRFANAVAKRESIYAGKIDKEDNDAMITMGRSMLAVSDDVLARMTDGLRERIATMDA